MKALDNLITRLKEVEGGVMDVVKRAVMDNEVLICEMNSVDQLYEKGINRHGVEIASYAPYSPVTIFLKKEKGQITSHVTLYDEGDFHESFYIKFNPESFEITASNWKTNKLTKGYGEEIFGLTDENFAELAEFYIKPAIINYLKTA